MRNLSELFSRPQQHAVDPEKSRVDDELLNDFMDQDWRQRFLAQESYLNPSPSSSSVCMFGDGPVSRDSRPRKRKASEGLFGHIYQFFQTFDVDYRRCHGDGLRGSITLSSKRRAVNNDHSYFTCAREIPEESLPSRDERSLAVRRARKAVRRAVRTLNAGRR